jgi:hypothetical protein
MLAAFLLGACASAPSATPQQDPELFRRTYDFSGSIEGEALSGRFWFREPAGGQPLELHMSSVAGVCRREIHQVSMSHMYVSCGGIQLEFVQGGRVVERSSTSWRTTRPQQRRACLTWTTQNGQRVCAMWGTEIVDAPTTLRGTVTLRRVEGAE